MADYDRLIMELDILMDETAARIERIKAMFADMRPEHAASARYQRTRLICSSKRRTRAYLEGR